MSVTWSPTDNFGSVKAVCTSGNEAVNLQPTDGVLLANAGAIDIYVEADEGRTLSGAGVLPVFVQNKLTGHWALADWTLIVPSGASGLHGCTFGALSPGKGIPIISHIGDRLAVLPTASNGGTAVTISAGGVTIYFNVQPLKMGA